MVKSTLIESLVYHERFKPFNHRFIYKMFYLKFSIDHLDKLQSPIFSINGFNLFSFYEKDYLDGSKRNLRVKIEEVLRAEGMDSFGDIVLQTAPRMFGYGFNPVSFWYIYGVDQKLSAILAEVNNTFGDRHYYLLQGFGEYKQITTNKVFHVSPFFGIEGTYEFSFNPKSIIIDYFDPKTHDYYFKSTLGEIKVHDFSTGNLLKMLLKFPFMTFFVTARIHWQALKLFFKKATFYTRPEPPEKKLSKEIKS